MRLAILLLCCTGVWSSRVFGRTVGIVIWPLIGIIEILAVFSGRLSGIEAVGILLLALLVYLFAVCLRLGAGLTGLAAAGALLGRLFGVQTEESGFLLLFGAYIGCRCYKTAQGETDSSRAEEGGLKVLAGVFCVCMFLAGAVPQAYREKLIDGSVLLQQQVLQQMRMAGVIHSDSGRINLGNNLPTGEERLELTAMQRPQETLYLKIIRLETIWGIDGRRQARRSTMMTGGIETGRMIGIAIICLRPSLRSASIRRCTMVNGKNG